MKIDKYKPHKVVDGYQLKKQLGGLYKIIEYSHISNEKHLRKRTIYKDLNLSDAEDKIYRLESQLK